MTDDRPSALRPITDLVQESEVIRLQKEVRDLRTRVAMALAISEAEQLAQHNPGAPIPAEVLNFALDPGTYSCPKSWYTFRDNDFAVSGFPDKMDQLSHGRVADQCGEYLEIFHFGGSPE